MVFVSTSTTQYVEITEFLKYVNFETIDTRNVLSFRIDLWIEYGLLD